MRLDVELFFFSSRRRHTRCSRDWSSDVCSSDLKAGWQSSLLILPVVYLIFRSYRLYLARLEAERNHAEGMPALHLRTIEALALAIEAKDHGTHEHLRRVQVYAMSIGKEMGLSPSELEALRVAAVLHEIGRAHV